MIWLRGSSDRCKSCLFYGTSGPTLRTTDVLMCLDSEPIGLKTVAGKADLTQPTSWTGFVARPGVANPICFYSTLGHIRPKACRRVGGRLRRVGSQNRNRHSKSDTADMLDRLRGSSWCSKAATGKSHLTHPICWTGFVARRVVQIFVSIQHITVLIELSTATNC